MPRKVRQLLPVELKNQFTQAIRQTAIRPSIVAYQPQDYQVDFHKDEAKAKLLIGGNRSGKTVCGGTEATWWLTHTHPYRDTPLPPVFGRAIAVDVEEGIEKIIKPEIEKWMPPSFLNNGSWDDSYSKSQRTLTLTNGSTLEFMSYEQATEKFAGTSRHFVWFDEECPEPIFNENMLRLVDTGGSWWMTMTPLIEMTWVEDRIYDPWKQGAKDYSIFEVSSLQNKHITEENLAAALVGISEEEIQARTHGTFIKHTGLVYAKQFTQENLMEDILESDDWPLYHAKWGHFIMMDHGYNNPTAFLFGCYDQEGRVIIYDEIYQSKKLVWENAEDVLKRIEKHRIQPTYIVGDPTIDTKSPITGTTIQIEYGEAGVYIALGFHDISPGISRVQSRFSKNLLYITRRCEKLLWELNRYRWDKFASAKIAVRRNQKEVPLKKDDHALDALRYGICSRPALYDEIALPVGNILGCAEVAIDLDWEKMTNNPEEHKQYYDDMLGTEW